MSDQHETGSPVPQGEKSVLEFCRSNHSHMSDGLLSLLAAECLAWNGFVAQEILATSKTVADVKKKLELHAASGKEAYELLKKQRHDIEHPFENWKPRSAAELKSSRKQYKK